MVLKQLPETECRKAEDVRRQSFILEIIKKDKGLILSKKLLVEKFIDHLIRINDN